MDEWQKHLRNDMKKSGKDLADFPDYVVVSTSKKVNLQDDILRMIWQIKKQNKSIRSEQQAIRAALRFYLRHLNR